MESYTITSPPGGAQSIVMSMSVCLSAHITQKQHGRSLPDFVCMLLGPRLTALWYIIYFRFCGWHCVFIAWGQSAWIKHVIYCSEVCQVAAPVGHQTNSVWLRSSECGAGGKVWYLWLLSTIFVIYAVETWSFGWTSAIGWTSGQKSPVFRRAKIDGIKQRLNEITEHLYCTVFMRRDGMGEMNLSGFMYLETWGPFLVASQNLTGRGC